MELSVGFIVLFAVATAVAVAARRLRVPYTVALISLDDPAGLRIVGNLVRVEPGALRVGLRVRAEWIEVAHEESGEIYRLPQWAPAEGSPGDP
jgi:uncharacterized OB-fold protein